MPLTLGIHKFRFPIGAPVAPIQCLSTTYINNHVGCEFFGCGPDAKQLTEHQYADEDKKAPSRQTSKRRLEPTQPKDPPPAHLRRDSSKHTPSQPPVFKLASPPPRTERAACKLQPPPRCIQFGKGLRIQQG